MSGIIGSITAGRLAFAIGTVGVGALVGGAVADHRDGDVAKGALIGGASALAGLALLHGGTAAWRHFTSARTSAATGAATLGGSIARTPIAPTTTTSISIAATKSAGTAAPVPATATGAWRTWVSSLFHEASSVATLRPLPVTVPAIAATPVLPAAATTRSGSTFLTTMSRFLPG